MNLVLRRRPSNDACTIGELYDDDGSFVCYVLEDPVREQEGLPVSAWKIPGKTAIPQGRRRVTITYSKRFQRPLPLVNMVPGFEGIRIHPGNGPDDTEGCLLPGMSVKPDDSGVLESRTAFKKLYDMIDAELHQGGEVWIDIRNA